MNLITLIVNITFWSQIKKYYGDNIMSYIHAIIVVILSTILWTFMLHENFLVSLMVGYFISDLKNVYKKKEFDMVFHHIFCIVFISYVYKTFPYNNIYETNAVSKTAILEISTPFLNMYKSTKKPIYGLMLIITFFFSRILWLTYIITKTFYGVPLEVLGNTERVFMTMFVLLNYWWFMKILRIAYRKYRN